MTLHVQPMELGGGELRVCTTGGTFCGIVQLGSTDQYGITLGAATRHAVGFMDTVTTLPILPFGDVVGPRSFPLTASGIFMCERGVAPVRFTTDARWNETYLPITDALIEYKPHAYDTFDLPPFTIACPSKLTGAELRVALAAAGRTPPDNLLMEAFERQKRPHVTGDIERRAWGNVIHWLSSKFTTWSSAPLPPVGSSVQINASGNMCDRGAQLCVVEPGELAWSAHPGVDVRAAPSTPHAWRTPTSTTPELVAALRDRYTAAVNSLRPVEVARVVALMHDLGLKGDAFNMPPLTAVRAALQNGTAEQVMAAVAEEDALRTEPDTLQRRLGLLVHAVGATTFYASYTTQREVLIAWATAFRSDVVKTTHHEHTVSVTISRGDTLTLNKNPVAFPRLGFDPTVSTVADDAPLCDFFMAAGAAAGAWRIATFKHPLSAIAHALVQLDALATLRAPPPVAAPPTAFILTTDSITRNLPTIDAVEVRHAHGTVVKNNACGRLYPSPR